MVGDDDDEEGATRAGKVLARRVLPLERFSPEQIASTAAGAAAAETAAVLIDQWGRAHSLREITIVGRDPERAGLAVFEASVSRQHCELRRDARTRRWLVSDLGSRNGVQVEGVDVTKPVPITDGQLLSIGDVGFVFVDDHNRLKLLRPSDTMGQTLRSQRGDQTGELLTLIQPSGGGGGVVQARGVSVQLGATQFALVHLLALRLAEERNRPVEVRGFVRSSELLGSLPWDTPHPEDGHIKQLVRRVRRALEKLDLGEVIESRHGFGYRLMIEALISGAK